ncbi:hypothetical protein K469DRAFT_593422 [Zopfia rhizophila CBS 207.26]|uniref:Rhodopsin domain-containing protein n=1 Tax=Zopfia rhizophila CBS 207.26 TaxID=1314779 RepID=A0A6A6DKF8_9PEZI|nr:hypothetical protein K469DRAFT_593422 [Zopfia rhizophila CBS 207.26]
MLSTITPGPTPPPDLSKIPHIPSKAAIALGDSFVGVSISLNILATFIFAGRLYTRIRPVWRMGWDDHFAGIAFCLMIIDTAMLMASVPWVFSPPEHNTLADGQAALRLATLSQPLWAWTIFFIKLSVATTILRVQKEPHWRIFLYFMIAVQLITLVYNTITQLIQCIPLSAIWDLTIRKRARCWTKKTRRISVMCVASINIMSDIVFSLIPISFLTKIHRPLREKIIIGILMALGLVASGASIAKTVAVGQFGISKDNMYNSVQIGMWSCLEEQIGFIAACVPCLKNPLQRVLGHFGLLSSSNYASSRFVGCGYGQMYGDDGISKNSKSTVLGQVRADGAMLNMKTLIKKVEDDVSGENILPSRQSGRDGEIWCTTEERPKKGELDVGGSDSEISHIGWGEGRKKKDRGFGV